ncbi:hypothetical protein PPGU19_011820 [Paraburkholderia sp. PGU19]|uniref:DUF3310 domain-containing protein n=1 Tax=Paraburkholderia sp. PGU19 TaxID=2735434 RepID=UPI0015DC806D|nr:DUF3310 domain-containing protein [Paraburkholderia sp. PGU19]BCF96613.1 hypothetical protein PPGU19_011820 [Paraburkholderia sp. PGU19]
MNANRRCPATRGVCLTCALGTECALDAQKYPPIVPSRSAEQVDHPKHYNAHPSGIECIDVVEHMGFNLGNAMKYIWRCDEKRDAIEDLKKARWYIEREIEKRLKERGAPATDWDVAKA